MIPLLLAAVLLIAPPAQAAADAVSAAAGLPLARAASMAWAPDATLIYVENDEALEPDGTSSRWGYLFASKSLDALRVYSIERGEIEIAEDLSLRFPAPPLPEDWIDSQAAVRAAEVHSGAAFRQESGARLRTACLLRGALRADQPDPAHWLVVYEASGAPGLFLLVDARRGEVTRTWRG